MLKDAHTYSSDGVSTSHVVTDRSAVLVVSVAPEADFYPKTLTLVQEILDNYINIMPITLTL
jgi:hypothetical protein